jgi:hypothetical protein
VDFPTSLGVRAEFIPTLVKGALVIIRHPLISSALAQAFPDEFHLRTLDTLLAACPELNVNVGIHSIMGGLMNRLVRPCAALLV